MDYIKINGYNIPYPNSFTLEKVPNVVAEIATMKGTQADINGMKYADTSLNWDTLIGEDYQNLLTAISEYTFKLECFDADGNRIELDAVRGSFSFEKTQFKYGGQILFSGLKLEVSFPSVYY